MIAAVMLSACADDEVILPGERKDLRELSNVAAVPATTTFRVPAQVNHKNWTHRGGSVGHHVQHPALGANLTQTWRADIGQGNTRRARITTDPIIAGGRIFTMDSASTVVATGVDGVRLWSAPLVPGTDSAKDASGGGLAYDDGTLIATTGFGETFALDATSGAQIWRQKLDAPVSATPLIEDGLVYVVSRDNRAWAINAKTGRLAWDVQAAPSNANIAGGAGAVVTGRAVVFPFGSGELIATLKKSGLRLWSSAVAGQRKGRAYAGFNDISSDPVVHDGRIYAGNQSGRVVAISAGSGKRLWSVAEGSYSPVLPAGGSVFLVNDLAELIRLDATTGAEIWRIRLPFYTDDKIKRRDEVFAHFGPILAGGRLIVASDDGVLRSFDPETGAVLGTQDLAAGAASNPVIVDGTLYLITDDGQLNAFR